MNNNDFVSSDKTRSLIKEHSKITEELLAMASGSDDVKIELNWDACPAHNVTRMLNGHFTGTVVKIHNPKTPFISIGTTINVCGVCIYKLKNEISIDDFRKSVISAMEYSPKPYTWNNFNRGNHFVSLMESDGFGILEPGQYLVVHASSNEYRNMLYPNKNVWYEDDIKIITHPDDPKRSLSYITGTTAEKFYKIAENLIPFNQKRNRDFSECVLGTNADKEILNIQHYGMPDIETVCIGVQWETDDLLPLLTAPGKDIYIVKAKNGQKYFPHGLGLEIYDGDIHYTDNNGMYVGTKFLTSKDSLSIGIDAHNRADKRTPEDCVQEILKFYPATIEGKLKQIASFSARGFEIWRNFNGKSYFFASC